MYWRPGLDSATTDTRMHGYAAGSEFLPADKAENHCLSFSYNVFLSIIMLVFWPGHRGSVIPRS